MRLCVSPVLHLTSIFLHHAPRTLSKKKIILFIFSLPANLQLLFRIPDSTFVSHWLGISQRTRKTKDGRPKYRAKRRCLFPLLDNAIRRIHFWYEPISPNSYSVPNECIRNGKGENYYYYWINDGFANHMNDMPHAIFVWFISSYRVNGLKWIPYRRFSLELFMQNDKHKLR